MKWYGIIAFLMLFSILGGLVYLGSNTDKLGGGFGEPSYISSQFTPPSNDLPSFSFSSIGFGSSYDIDVDKLQAEIERKILSAQSPEEIDDIIREIMFEPFKDPRATASCTQVIKDMEREQQKMEKWLLDGNDYRLYPTKNMEKMLELVQQSQLCFAAYQEGLIDNPVP